MVVDYQPQTTSRDCVVHWGALCNVATHLLSDTSLSLLPGFGNQLDHPAGFLMIEINKSLTALVGLAPCIECRPAD